MKTKLIIHSLGFVLAFAIPAVAQSPAPGEFKPQYELGVPTKETAERMFDELTCNS
jgi:hypothetical protein